MSNRARRPALGPSSEPEFQAARLVLPRSRFTEKQASRCRGSQIATTRRLRPSEVLTVVLVAAPVSRRQARKGRPPALTTFEITPRLMSPRVASGCLTLQDLGDGPRRERLLRTPPVRATHAGACGVGGSVPGRGLLAVGVSDVVGKPASGAEAFEEPRSTYCGRIGRGPSSETGKLHFGSLGWYVYA